MIGPHQHPSRGPQEFATTHWSVVLAAVDGNSAAAPEALAQLCATYWYPLYAFVRRRGNSPHDAEDLTQEFFYHLLNKGTLSRVDRGKGRFRSFLLGALEYFLANQWRDARRQKRGGGVTVLSLDSPDAEGRYAEEPSGELSAEQIYLRTWAATLLDQVLHQLKKEYVAAGKGPMFEALAVFLTGEKSSLVYAELAARLATTEDAIKKAVSRLRQRYGERLRAEIGRTVSGPEEVEDELRALHAALATGR